MSEPGASSDAPRRPPALLLSRSLPFSLSASPGSADRRLVRVCDNSKDRSEFLDPCQEAAARSIRCLHRNGGDRTMCSDYFQSVAAAAGNAMLEATAC